MGTNGAVGGTGDPSVSPFQIEKALSCHLVIKHTPYKTLRQRTNPVTSETTANCSRFPLLDGTHVHTRGSSPDAGPQSSSSVRFLVDTGLWLRFTPRSRAACQTRDWIPLLLLCALLVWGGALCSLHLSARFPPTLTASPALEPRTENKPFPPQT